ncbi:uncharacterized protein KQ657_001259 [Scheffersomyces spartinae]|uniref:Amino acid permease/ SLC12A domain-containing protein n=1 Tax=Scheffersomyces spartinae TaxID=45513 RepID=A0A9P7V7H4_9ASCO|nr:uncharacterized protein KQ657_001259 [Scheffersomyces spartinae]KAG7192804.1 hypothetical protein KQ657_001259 [Scheffersomyces spartinae]
MGINSVNALLQPPHQQYQTSRRTKGSSSLRNCTAASSNTTAISANGATVATHIKKSLSSKNEGKLSTFEGVFLPTSLNVLSILMFLRFGFILGQMGIIGTFFLLILSYTINVLTTLSVSAISTNGTVKGGGAYYMISRSLGPEFGGAIGIIFFIGQILNSSLNVVGIIEPILVNFGAPDGDMAQWLPDTYVWQNIYLTGLLFLCTCVAVVGSSLVSKTAFWLFVMLTISTLSIPVSTFFKTPGYYLSPPYDGIFYTGLSWTTFQNNLWPKFTSGAAGSVLPPGVKESFRDLFGIFFPATAGILAGASMSGELKTPSKSIPRGTIQGLVVTFCLYSLVILLMGFAIPRQMMYVDIKIIQTVNTSDIIIILGELSTSLFSVIMGIVGAASMLNAIADDKILPGLGIFTTMQKSKKEKDRAAILAIVATWFIAQVFLFANINVIASFITMAFLMTFIVTNLACLLLKLGSAPNFRPSFKYFGARTAFFGVLFCFAAMYIVDGLSATAVILFLMLLIFMIHYMTPPSKFGDISQLLIYHQVRKYLLRLKLNLSVKYWRPQILLLSDDPRTSWNLICFCNHLKKGGLYILGHVIIMNDVDELEGGFNPHSYKEVEKQRKAWVKIRDLSQIKAFVQISVGPSLPWGVRNVYLGSGLGGMRPNITVIGFYDFVKHGVDFSLLSSGITSLPTDECRKEKKVSISQWVQIVEDLIVMQATVAVASNFSQLQLPNSKVTSTSLFSTPNYTDKKKKYIDLYPIQMSSIDKLDNGKSVLSTNFDTYTLILQLGYVLSSVNDWKYTNHTIRVVAFVELKSEVEEERKRVCELLVNLRIDAEVKVICFEDNQLNTYNFIVKGYAKNKTNKEVYGGIDEVLKNEQWWKNLKDAREALREVEKQRFRKKAQKIDTQARITFAPLNLQSTSPNPTGMSFQGKRRYTMSNLHERGLSVSMNINATPGGGMDPFFRDPFESEDSSSESERETETASDSSVSSILQFESRMVPPRIESGAQTQTTEYRNQLRKPNTQVDKFMKVNTNNMNDDALSTRSSRSALYLKPNFQSVMIPQTQLNDDDDGGGDDAGDYYGKSPEVSQRRNIGFVDDVDEEEEEEVVEVEGEEEDDDDVAEGSEPKGEKVTDVKSSGIIPKSGSISPKNPIGSLQQQRGLPLNAKDLEYRLNLHATKGSGLSVKKLQQKLGRKGDQTPSIMIADDETIRHLRTPQFLATDNGEDEDIPVISDVPSTIHRVGSVQSNATDEVFRNKGAGQVEGQGPITQKQLQEELTNLSFNSIPAKGQHLILNELMKMNSTKDSTTIIFSTLPTPELGTHLNNDDSYDYANNLAIWMDNLPPMLLFNSQTVTVTTAL